MALNPIQYSLNAPDPGLSVLQGAEFGQGLVQTAENRGLAQDANRRADAANMRAQSAEGRAAELQPLRLQQAQLQIDTQQQALNQAREQQARQQRFSSQMQDLVRKGRTASFEDFAALTAEYPEMGSATLELYDALDDNRKKPLVNTLAQSVTALKGGNIDLGIQVAEQFVQAAEASGDVQLAEMGRSAVELAKVDPEAAYAQMGLLLQQIEPDLAKQAITGTSSATRGSQILPDGTTIRVTDAGPVVQSADGTVLKGQDAQNAIREAQRFGADVEREKFRARETGKLETQAELAGEVAAAKDLGKATAGQAVKAFEALGKVRANIGTIDTAIRALDEGAKSGAIQRYFPNITAASAELENAMNRMGLDVIGSVTFGALSEGEMRLAMETAVPRNLNEEDLRGWLEEKRAAQQKAAQALSSAAEYLSTPGNTLNKWITEGQYQAGGQPTPQTTQPTPQPAAQPAREGQNDLQALFDHMNAGGKITRDQARQAADALGFSEEQFQILVQRYVE